MLLVKPLTFRCGRAIRRAFYSSFEYFEADQLTEAQCWISGLDILIEDFSLNSKAHEQLKKELKESREVVELRELVVNKKNSNEWFYSRDVDQRR